MTSNKLAGLIAASATALALSGAALAGEAPKSKTIGSADEVKCAGVNSCKGASDCKTDASSCGGASGCGSAGNSCKGANTCKGKGWKKLAAGKCLTDGGKIVV